MPLPKKKPATRDEAIELFRDSFPALCPDEIAVTHCQGLVSATNVTSGQDLPQSSRSAMDGYALRSADTEAATGDLPVILQCLGEVRPSDHCIAPIGKGQARRILTGGILPDGADAVIPFERVETNGSSISISSKVEQFLSVRMPGSDIMTGNIIAGKGEELNPGHCALMAYAGMRTVKAHPRPSILALAVGNELSSPLMPAPPGKIPADNLVLLKALCSRYGFYDVTVSTCPNDRETITDMICAEKHHDLIITTGGTGPGQRDFVLEATLDAGSTPLFKGLKMHPAKSVFACNKKGIPVIGLPGPPNAVQLAFHVLIRPFLDILCGRAKSIAPINARLTKPLKSSRDTERLWLCRLNLSDTGLEATPLNDRNLSVRQAMCSAEGIIILPPSETEPKSGQNVPVMFF